MSGWVVSELAQRAAEAEWYDKAALLAMQNAGGC
jgi:hypothetical protein